jgi:hypothetical protein
MPAGHFAPEPDSYAPALLAEDEENDAILFRLSLKQPAWTTQSPAQRSDHVLVRHAFDVDYFDLQGLHIKLGD